MIEWLKTFRDDFTKVQFIPLKILFFFMFGGMASLLPFLTIQARSLGITGEELGIIYSLSPVVGILVPSLAGLIADKIGNFKIFLSSSVMCSGLAALLFIVIPVGRIEHTLPDRLPLVVNCTMHGSNIEVIQPFSCDVRNDSKNTFLDVHICKPHCSNDFQKKHLIDEFIETWCDATQPCNILNEIEIESDNEYLSYNSSQYSEGEKNIQTNPYQNLYNINITLPLKLQSTLLEDQMSINRPFCPLFKEFIELNEQFSPTLILDEADRKECWLECDASAETEAICKNTKSIETIDPTLTVMIYILVRLINSLTLATSMTLFEGAVVAIINQHKGDLGLQRVYGNIGMIVFTPISGMLIDSFSKRNNMEDYSPAFYLYCGIKFLCAGCLLFINLDFKLPSNRVIKDFKGLIKDSQVLSFLLFTLVSGTSFGFVETFLFWLLEDLGGSKSLMGITVTVGASFGIPLLIASSFFIRKLGHVNTLVLCSFVYVIRLAGYSLITNPWGAMPFEALESFTNSLMGVASISYVGVLSKPSTVASLQGLYGGTYHGVGRGIGSLCGGILIKHLGNALTFQIFAATMGLSGIIYYAVNYFFFPRKDSKTEKEVQIKVKDEDETSKDINMDKSDTEINEALSRESEPFK